MVQNYHLVVDFKYLNFHLLDIKFSNPEIKHVLHKIGRHSSRVFSMLDLKHAFHSMNLTVESKQYQLVRLLNNLISGANVSSANFMSLINDLLHKLPPDIMDDAIIFIPDIKTHKKVIKHFMFKLKEYGMLSSINKIHTFHSKVKYMVLLLSRNDNLPTISLLRSRVRVISTLPITITGREINSLTGCAIYLAQFLPKLSELIKPINVILKKCNKINKVDKINPLATYNKGKGSGRKSSPDIHKFWMPIHSKNFEAIKTLHLSCTCQ